MVVIEQINKNNKEKLHDFLLKAKEFNELNEDFYSEFKKLDFFTILKLKKKVFLFKDDKKYIGFIWIERTDERLFKILSLYLEDIKESIELKHILYFLHGNHRVYYECRLNHENKMALEKLGFIRKNHSIEMKRLAEDLMEDTEDNSNIEYRIFRENIDERKRWKLQNEIFKSDKRIPLSLKDIIDDEFQNYYIEGAGYFILVEGKYIGYGQLIKHDYKDSALLVNFGIIEEYRHKGYGNLFLSYILSQGKIIGFNNIYLRVNPDNIGAIKLYSNAGFRTYSNIFSYEYTPKK